MVQLSYPYMTTGKAIALTRWAFVGKVVSLFFDMLLIIGLFPKEQESFKFMAADTICSDFGVQRNSLSLFPHLFAMK